jgi:hypothetical protein
MAAIPGAQSGVQDGALLIATNRTQVALAMIAGYRRAGAWGAF